MPCPPRAAATCCARDNETGARLPQPAWKKTQKKGIWVKRSNAGQDNASLFKALDNRAQIQMRLMKSFCKKDLDRIAGSSVE